MIRRGLAGAGVVWLVSELVVLVSKWGGWETVCSVSSVIRDVAAGWLIFMLGMAAEQYMAEGMVR